eukprot:jgi/Tetstr1/426728/TSEL_001665.t1
MNDILPRFRTRNSDTNTPTPGFFDPQLDSVLGRGSFNATSSARRYDHFLNDAHGSDSYAAEMREAWGRLQAATAVPLGNTVIRKELKDLVPDAELSLPEFNVVTGSYDPRSLKSTLLEFKTMRYGVKDTAVPRATAVDHFERSLLGDIQRGLVVRDAAWHNTEPGQKRNLDLDAKVRELLASYYGEAAFSAVAADLLKPCGEDWLASQVLEGEGEGKANRIQWEAAEFMLEKYRAEQADEEAGD